MTLERKSRDKVGVYVVVYCIHSLYDLKTGEEKCYKENLTVPDSANLVNQYKTDNDIEHCFEYFKAEQDADRHLKNVKNQMLYNEICRRRRKGR